MESKSVGSEGRRCRQQRKLSAVEAAAAAAAGRRRDRRRLRRKETAERKLRSSSRWREKDTLLFSSSFLTPGSVVGLSPVLHTGARGPDPDSSGGLESEVKRAERRGGGSGKKGKEERSGKFMCVCRNTFDPSQSLLSFARKTFFLNLFRRCEMPLPPPQLNFPLIKLSLSLFCDLFRKSVGSRLSERKGVFRWAVFGDGIIIIIGRCRD